MVKMIMKRIPYLIVFISGFCALTYQIVWERLLKYIFGGDAISSTIITSIFLLGLGLGSWIFRKYRVRSYLWYAAIELGIAFCGLASYFVLSHSAGIYNNLIFGTLATPYTLRIFMALSCSVLLLIPCLLLGGTLPLFFNTFIRTQKYSAKQIGGLYGLNTVGAAFGIVSAPFLLLNTFTLPETLQIIAGGNILLAAVIYAWGRVTVVPDRNTLLSEAQTATPPGETMLLSFISGFFALSVEIVFFRMAAHYWPSSSYNFSLVLLMFLTGLGVGSMVFTRVQIGSVRQIYLRICLLFLLSLSGILVSVTYRHRLIFEPHIVHILVQYGILILPFSLFQGAIFPLLLLTAKNASHQLPEYTGKLYLVNAIGAFLGIWFISLYGFTWFGTANLLFMLAIGICMVIGFLWYRYRLSVPILPLAGLIICCYFFIPESYWNMYVFGKQKDFQGLEGTTGTAAIDWNPDRMSGVIKVNGQYMSFLPDHPKHVRLAIYPLTLQHRKRILVLGLGGGGMVRELAKDPQVEKIDVVDWSSELFRILATKDAAYLLQDVLSHPKVTSYQGDARVLVRLLPAQKYDVIVDNLAVLQWDGGTAVKSEQYFREIRRIISDNGTYVLDINPGSDEYNGPVLSALFRSFPIITTHFWTIALATVNPLVLDDAAIEKVLAERSSEPTLNITPPNYLGWMYAGLEERNRNEYLRYSPIRDEDIRHEFYIKSLIFHQI